MLSTDEFRYGKERYRDGQTAHTYTAVGNPIIKVGDHLIINHPQYLGCVKPAII